MTYVFWRRYSVVSVWVCKDKIEFVLFVGYYVWLFGMFFLGVVIGFMFIGGFLVGFFVIVTY